MKPPTFYFTAHPGDLSRRRLPEGAHVMLVAAAHWDNRRKRFRVRRPPFDHIGQLVIDSGGFTAARRWGVYPWTPEQYADWIHATCQPAGLERLVWCACMDYACERAVNRAVLSTNLDRINATHELERACRKVASDLPWLPVLQGDTIAERMYDLSRRRHLQLVPTMQAGIGSVCGRRPWAAARVALFYRSQLPTVKLHGFGLDVRVLDKPDAWQAVDSWDSYAWTWPPGAKGKDRPKHLYKRADESHSSFRKRLGKHYLEHTVGPRLAPPTHQFQLF